MVFTALAAIKVLPPPVGTLAHTSLVSFPYPVPKTAHRAARGRVWFWPAGWRLSGGLSSLSAIPCKKSSRRKNTPACFSKIEPVKFAIPCKRLSKSPEENFFSLFSGADFALPQSDPRTYAPRYFRTQTADPAFPWPGPHVSPHSLAGTAHPTPSCSNLYATASWMGRIVYRSTPFCTLPSLPWTVVFSVSMSLFSSNR